VLQRVNKKAYYYLKEKTLGAKLKVQKLGVISGEDEFAIRGEELRVRA